MEKIKKIDELNIVKIFKEKKKELNKQVKIQEVNNKKYQKELDVIMDKYKPDSYQWTLKNKIKFYDGLLNFRELFLIRDFEGGLTLTKLNKIDMYNVTYFDGWKIGVNQKIPKSRIICPFSWITQFSITHKSTFISIETPENKFYKIVLKDKEYIFISGEKLEK